MFHASTSQGTSLRKYQFFGLFLTLLLACGALFSLAGTAHAASISYNRTSAVSFANTRWNCAEADCSSRVSQGDAQPNYECAEFVSRALSYGGLTPGMNYYATQAVFGNYNPGNGKIYDMLLVTPLSGYHTFESYLTDYGLATNIGQNLSAASDGDVVIFTNASGTPEHTVIIDSAAKSALYTGVDAHNNAAYKVSLSSEAAGFSSWYILHITV